MNPILSPVATTNTDVVSKNSELSKRIRALFGDDLVYDHPDFFVLNKASGLACHGPDAENLADLLAQHKIKPFLCHRLDKETSGLIIIAKSSEAANYFRELFENNKIGKYYLAISHKKGKKKQGAIKGQLKKSRNGNWILGPDSANNSLKSSLKGSAEQGSVIKTQFFSFGLTEQQGLRCFIVKLIGGKTHQIRVCLKANGSPILGDVRYGGQANSCLHLHAYGLEFQYGEESIKLLSEAKFLPSSIKALNASLGHTSEPWSIAWPK